MKPPYAPSRRALLAGSAAAVAASSSSIVVARADETPVLRIGTLPFGSVHWTVAAITGNGFDVAAGVKVENVPLASNEAGRIGLLSGSVDAIMTDLLFAARLRSEGKGVKFLPYTSTEGSLIVPAQSPIRSVADLAGHSIGIAGGPLDKNWLLLQALATKQGLDLTKQARPSFGAPPLLALKVENGELDSGLLYWPYVARLESKGFRAVESAQSIADHLGAKVPIAFGGFVFRVGMSDATMAAFGKALRAAEVKMSEDPSIWDKLRPLMKAPDERTFEALKTAFLQGIPKKSLESEIADARSLYAMLAEIGGPALVGKATALPDGLYVDQKVYG